MNHIFHITADADGTVVGLRKGLSASTPPPLGLRVRRPSSVERCTAGRVLETTCYLLVSRTLGYAFSGFLVVRHFSNTQWFPKNWSPSRPLTKSAMCCCQGVIINILLCEAILIYDPLLLLPPVASARAEPLPSERYMAARGCAARRSGTRQCSSPAECWATFETRHDTSIKIDGQQHGTCSSLHCSFACRVRQ